MLTDHRDAPITGATPAALDLYETAIAQFNCYRDDPVATLDGAIAESPDFAMAQIAKGYLLVGATEKDLVPEAARLAERVRGLELNERERAHAGALQAFVQGEMHEASRRLDRILADDPRDIVALQVGHLFDFYRGDSRNLRDRVGRALPEWSADLPGYHAVLGMYAFGLEECADYRRAERYGREAVALNPQDGWAHHAVAHVMEMEGRAADGLGWLTEGSARWSDRSFFAVHNWWHLALFRLEQDDVAGVLALYDEAVRGGRSSVVLDMIDASALLWRLHLRGIDVGARWQEIADAWLPRLTDGYYAFNDVHALMAMLGAGRLGDADRLIGTMQAAASGAGANRHMTREVGLPLAHGLMSFHRAQYEAAADALLAVRPIAHRFGGSHAQRDVIDLTLIEAAHRGRLPGLVRSLANERLQHRPDSPLARRYRAAAMAARDAAGTPR
jgi:tetratricopeptide (TPR) repeat protein